MPQTARHGRCSIDRLIQSDMRNVGDEKWGSQKTTLSGDTQKEVDTQDWLGYGGVHVIRVKM